MMVTMVVVTMSVMVVMVLMMGVMFVSIPTRMVRSAVQGQLQQIWWDNKKVRR